MRSDQLVLADYDTDKVSGGYLRRYDPILDPWVNQKITLLEIGIHRGESLRLWRDYFPLGTIVGIDIRLPKDFPPLDRIHLFQGSQADTAFLSRVAAQTAPEGFDIIIDDASHIGELTRKSFWHLFDHHLKPGGLYVIEDWGTGYWDDWPDGMALRSGQRSWLSALWARVLGRFHAARRIPWKVPFDCHSYGMVGFVKQLVDEQGAADVTRGRARGTPTRQSKFESLLFTPSIVFVKKAAASLSPK